MKLDTATLLEKFTIASALLKKHAVVLCFVIFGVICAYIMITVSQLSGREPSQANVDKQIKAVARPKIDPKTAEIMEDLRERSVTIQTLFEQARDNPFTE